MIINMKINIIYNGPTSTCNQRRDFMLMLKYGLETNGHDVVLSHNTYWPDCLNILFAGHNIPADALKGYQYAVINTETIDNDMLNYKPTKGDFKGQFIPLLQGAKFIWDVIPQNLEQYAKYDLEAKFLRWGYVPELEEIKHAKEKDLDFYFFGNQSPHRVNVINSLLQQGFKGVTHWDVPYFVRNDYIARSKVCLNLIQDPQFRHVNNFRICYLANNKCAVLAQVVKELSDPANYFLYASELFSDVLNDLEESLTYLLESHKEKGEESYFLLKEQPAKDILAQLLEESL
jgi:hypothetical protein